MITVPIIKGDRQSNYDYRDNLPVNMVAVVRPIKGDRGYLIAHDGLTEFTTTGGAARGAIFSEQFNAHFRVSGTTLEQITATGQVIQIGGIPGTGVCAFAESFNSICIVSDGRAYIYDGATLTEISDEDLGVALDVTWFRGIYVFTDGEFLYHTELGNEYSIRQLDYSSSEFAADPIVGVMRNEQNQIIAFNRYSTEYFYFNANADINASVLQVIDGKSSRVGIVGRDCKCMLDGQIFILGGRKGESPSIQVMQGSGAESVASREVDQVLAKYTEDELSNAYLESRVEKRDKFLIVHLPRHTLLFNLTVAQAAGKDSAWSYLKTGDCDPWRAKFGIFDPRASKWIYGDTKTDKLTYLDDKSFAQLGEKQEAEFYTPLIGLETLSINKMEIETIPGYATNNFTCAMSFSDNGEEWGQEYWNLVSTIGDYDKRYTIRRLGYVRQFIAFKFRFISNDKMSFTGLKIDAT